MKYTHRKSSTHIQRRAKMNLPELKKIAQKIGVPATGGKAEIIRSIQRKEGNFDCFGTAIDGYCDQYNCLWRSDCLKPAKKSQ